MHRTTDIPLRVGYNTISNCQYMDFLSTNLKKNEHSFSNRGTLIVGLNACCRLFYKTNSHKNGHLFYSLFTIRLRMCLLRYGGKHFLRGDEKDELRTSEENTPPNPKVGGKISFDNIYRRWMSFMPLGLLSIFNHTCRWWELNISNVNKKWRGNSSV